MPTQRFVGRTLRRTAQTELLPLAGARLVVARPAGFQSNGLPPMEDIATRPTADQLNQRLTDGGFVQITTYTRSTIYKRQHAGWFTERDGSLYVQTGHTGRMHNRLSHGDALLVGIRTGTIV